MNDIILLVGLFASFVLLNVALFKWGMTIFWWVLALAVFLMIPKAAWKFLHTQFYDPDAGKYLIIEVPPKHERPKSP